MVPFFFLNKNYRAEVLRTWNKKISAFIPGKNNISTHLKPVGSANGKFTLSECILSAEKAMLEILLLALGA